MGQSLLPHRILLLISQVQRIERTPGLRNLFEALKKRLKNAFSPDFTLKAG
jgi:hypothetical protein